MHIDAEVQAYGGNYLYDLYSFYQNTELEKDFESWIIENYPEHELFAMIYADVVDEFENLKNEYGFLNFNDLLLNFRKMCETEDLGYQEVLVDEYQDTNALQGTLIEMMKPPSLFCVGDYDQSIYAFNGADITIIGSFTTKYPNAVVHTLTKNYRSTVPILSLANKVIEHNERIYPKKLEVTRTYEAQAPKLLAYDELFDQYHGVAALIRDTATPREEIAVIFRNNSSADGIEVGLRELGIACKRKGGTSFFDSREVKAILDLCTLLINEADMMAFIHLFEFARGIGSAMAKELYIGLKTLGNGNMFYGLYAYDASITNPFEKRKLNHQLGLFDDFLELGAVGKYAKLGFEAKFMKNPILNVILLSCLTSFSACSQNTKTEKESKVSAVEQEGKKIKTVPHRYGGWYCPDNLNGFPAVDISDWENVPVVNGRMATKEETSNGTSLIFVDKKKYPNAVLHCIHYPNDSNSIG